MSQLDWTLGLLMIASSLGTALLALLFLGHIEPRRKISWTPAEQMGETVVFLFRDRDLVDATDGARALLASGPDYLDDWSRTVAVVESRFPEFGREVGELDERQRIVLRNPDDVGEVEAEWRSGLTRVVVRSAAANQRSDGVLDPVAHETLNAELESLRAVIDDAPILAWKEDDCGAVRWANRAYISLAERIDAGSEPIGWPLPRIFEQRPIGPDFADPPRRLSVQVRGEEQRIWFDCYDMALGDDELVFALPADRLVKAESTLREFVQTLTKTFAHLPTGLAVFDKERRLAVFNPALTDLSSLDPLFLSRRPTLIEFLDSLRENHRMPEPKDYKSWRAQITEMESAAASGTHQETWSLPGGQTFRVTGRPHPDGAVAFLFEDISDEIATTRHFRAELSVFQSAIDSLEEAIAVFSESGKMILSNDAYNRLWNHDSSDAQCDLGIVEVTRHWQTQCAPSPTWGDLRDFVGDSGERAEWSADLRMLDGRALACRFSPLAGHATLVGFSQPGPLSRWGDEAWHTEPVAIR